MNNIEIEYNCNDISYKEGKYLLKNIYEKHPCNGKTYEEFQSESIYMPDEVYIDEKMVELDENGVEIINVCVVSIYFLNNVDKEKDFSIKSITGFNPNKIQFENLINRIKNMNYEYLKGDILKFKCVVTVGDLLRMEILKNKLELELPNKNVVKKLKI